MNFELSASELWGWLFNNHDTRTDIGIEWRYCDGNTAILRLFLSRHEKAALS